MPLHAGRRPIGRSPARRARPTPRPRQHRFILDHEDPSRRPSTTRRVSDPIEYLDLDDLIELARTLLGHPPPIRDVGLLPSAVARPQTSVSGQDAYPDVLTTAAALLQSIVNNHALATATNDSAWSQRLCFANSTAARLPVPPTTTSATLSSGSPRRNPTSTTSPLTSAASRLPESRATETDHGHEGVIEVRQLSRPTHRASRCTATAPSCPTSCEPDPSGSCSTRWRAA